MNALTADKAITIRPAQLTDAPAFRELRLEALRTHPEAFLADYAANEAEPITFWEGRIAATGSHSAIYFATHEDKLIGMCGIRRGTSPKTEHGAGIWGVYVQPAWRGRHIAEEMLEACVGWARENRVSVVKLAVVSTNGGAIRCYLRCGFQVYGVEPQALFHHGVMQDDLLMARIL